LLHHGWLDWLAAYFASSCCDVAATSRHKILIND
jgi:hypothetical protein